VVQAKVKSFTLVSREGAWLLGGPQTPPTPSIEMSLLIRQRWPKEGRREVESIGPKINGAKMSLLDLHLFSSSRNRINKPMTSSFSDEHWPIKSSWDHARIFPACILS
jgi:hypothetical protein